VPGQPTEAELQAEKAKHAEQIRVRCLSSLSSVRVVVICVLETNPCLVVLLVILSRLQAAIQNATTLEEVQALERSLQEGKLPTSTTTTSTTTTTDNMEEAV
jgi:hypothetical protein